LKNVLFLYRILDHLSYFNFFDGLNNNVVFMFFAILIKLGLEDSGLGKILETPDHGTTGNNIFNFFLQLFVDGSVNGFVETCAVLWNLGGCFNYELVNYVILLLEINLVKICKEMARLGRFEL
jgi:hypothetical protein